MKLNRSLIKSQAKELIKGHIINLFILTIVIGILSSFASMIIDAKSVYGNDPFSEYFSGEYFNFDEPNGSGNNSFDRGHFDNFNGKITPVKAIGFVDSLSKNEIREMIIKAAEIINIVMIPLSITLLGVYISLIRGRSMRLDESFGYVFKNTFTNGYFRKLWLYILQNIILSIMFCLFIIPGIIFYYRYYFATAIMADNPNIKAGQALKISSKMTDGHKGELFALDLSFIGWAILTVLTVGILSIYALPYYVTTRTLYYENFRIRSFQEGRITEVDFMTDEQKAQYYYGPQTSTDYRQSNYQQYQQTEYYQPNQRSNEPQYYSPPQPENQFGSGQSNDYYNGNY